MRVKIKQQNKTSACRLARASCLILPTNEFIDKWERGLAHQLNDLPEFEKVLEELKNLIRVISK